MHNLFYKSYISIWICVRSNLFINHTNFIAISDSDYQWPRTTASCQRNATNFALVLLKHFWTNQRPALLKVSSPVFGDQGSLTPGATYADHR